MKDIKNFLDFLKLPPTILTALALASGLLLFAPDEIVKKLYMTSFLEKHGFVLGIVFIVSLCLLTVFVIGKLLQYIYGKYKNASLIKSQTKYLEDIKGEKVSLICAFLQEPTRTLTLPMNNGVVIALEHCFVIEPAGATQFATMGWGDGAIEINYFLQPWVEARILANKNLQEKYGMQ